MSIEESNEENNIDTTLAKDPIKVANLENGKSQHINASPLLFTSSSVKLSKSKVIKSHAVHLIQFCLKSGISENKSIIKFLEENEIFLPGRTFDRYKNLAENQLTNDLDADIWLSEKTQSALIRDYKDISDRYDGQLELDDKLIQCLIKQAVDKAINFDNDPEKYYRYLDFGEIVKIQAISNYTMKNKLELISKGFMIYRIKKHIDDLRKQIQQNKSKSESKNLDLSSLPLASKPNISTEDTRNQAYQQQDRYDQKYLDENDLVIGMSGRPIKKYLAEFEQKFGKPLSTLYP